MFHKVRQMFCRFDHRQQKHALTKWHIFTTATKIQDAQQQQRQLIATMTHLTK